jgi:2-oxoglutarate dehydrogenase E1 component
MSAGNLTYLDDLYARYLKDPSAIAREWKRYFGALDGTRAPEADLRRSPSGAAVRPEAQQVHESLPTSLLDKVRQMIDAYRSFGHRAARVDPLGLVHRSEDGLSPDTYGFAPRDWELLVPCEELQFVAPVSISDIIARLQHTYCGAIGVEFMHLDEVARRWLQTRMESTENQPRLSQTQKLRILTRLTAAVAFEEFVRRKFVGAKSFSIEGAESLIPLVDLVIEHAAADSIQDIVIAMAHRGRLNVLTNIIGKRPRDIFREFAESRDTNGLADGDVKYHLGHSHDYVTASGAKIHLSLCFNPSHLEFVNPVALGRVRARQERVGDFAHKRSMALLIHGDAAFAGEGIVQETLNLSHLDAYAVGGTLHVMVNNQIGFTTCPDEARSTPYATDIGKMVGCPIFHVNGDDPEAVAWVVQLSMEFRKRFRRDVIIDMYCYRRWGHNEGDEPSFTQPIIYQAIRKQKTTREQYAQRLLEEAIVTAESARKDAANFRDMLDRELDAAAGKNGGADKVELSRGVWTDYHGGLESDADEPPTGLKEDRIAFLLQAQMRLPQGFVPHPKIERGMAARRKMASGELPLDWSAAEALAFASLVLDGIRVRLSGQDSGRGTFSQRHAVLHDYQNGVPYVPLQHLAADQAPVEMINSPLSEAGVLGFEYGYSLDCPGGLIVWEAQFGDFSNAAQVIIDQFIATAEEKWRRLSGLVLFLPHGFEGMGPEHSSARLERFLQLGAKDNIQVVYPTSPAQYFHCLRRQALRRWRKPLIVLTPKSLLRHPQVISPIAEFQGRFEPVIWDARYPPDQVKVVLLCSGKIFFELDKARQEAGRADIAIIRLEQLYPFPQAALKSALAPFTEKIPVRWVQEEPENMGAWSYLNLRLQGRLFGHGLSAVCRPAAASPATGWASSHKRQQADLLARALEQSDRIIRQATAEPREANVP